MGCSFLGYGVTTVVTPTAWRRGPHWPGCSSAWGRLSTPSTSGAKRSSTRAFPSRFSRRPTSASITTRERGAAAQAGRPRLTRHHHVPRQGPSVAAHWLNNCPPATSSATARSTVAPSPFRHAFSSATVSAGRGCSQSSTRIRSFASDRVMTTGIGVLLVSFDEERHPRVHPVFRDAITFHRAREIVDPDRLDVLHGPGDLPYRVLRRVIEALLGLGDDLDDFHDGTHGTT